MRDTYAVHFDPPSEAEVCPDLTPQMIAWLQERYPMPEWHGGDSKAEAQYHYERGFAGLTQMLADMRDTSD